MEQPTPKEPAGKSQDIIRIRDLKQEVEEELNVESLESDAMVLAGPAVPGTRAIPTDNGPEGSHGSALLSGGPSGIEPERPSPPKKHQA